MKKQLIAFVSFLVAAGIAEATRAQKPMDMETVKMVQEWDKTFPQSDRVEHAKVAFHNRYGITLVADLYKPARKGACRPSP